VQVTTLTSKLQLLDLVGHRPGVGHKLISEPTMAELQREWRLTVRATRAELLASEKELFRILIHAKREAEPSESPLTVPDQPSVTLRLLESAKSEVQSQAMGSRAVHRSPRLAWNLLVELYGSETILAERIQGLRNSDIEGKEDIVRLADKYLGGWRPNERD
jgi:hypothetical protein